MFDHERVFRRLKKRGYLIERLTEYQFRVECVLDLYPVRYRWHNVSNGKRGSWHGFTEDKLVSLIGEQTKQADAILDKFVESGPFNPPHETTDSSGRKKWLTKKPWWAEVEAKK
jgi:hypothetical protein